MLEHLTLILLPQHQCNKKAFLHKHLASNWYKTNLRQTDAQEENVITTCIHKMNIATSDKHR